MVNIFNHMRVMCAFYAANIGHRPHQAPVALCKPARTGYIMVQDVPDRPGTRFICGHAKSGPKAHKTQGDTQ